MKNELKKEDLEEFVVRIEYKKNQNELESASGVIVKISDSLVYILTVKHFLKRSYNQPIEKVEESIHITDLTIKNYRSDEIKIEKVLFVQNKELDILILQVDTSSLILFTKVNRLEIYMDNFHKCAIFGYPRSREKTNNSLVLHASHPDKIDLDENSFEVKSIIPLHSFHESETDNIKGLSGSGVFIKGRSGKVYLVGIQYQYMDIIYLKSLNLRMIKEDIHRVIEGELPIGEYPFFEELGVNMHKIAFHSLDEYFSLNQDIQKFNKKLKKNSDKALMVLEKEYTSLKENMRRVADKYFYLGKKSFEQQDLSRAYEYFSRAIELCPSYKHFFAKREFANQILTKEQEEARDNLSNEIDLIEDSSLIEEILEDEEKFLIKNGDKIGLEKIYTKLISLSSKSKNKLVKLFFKLSKIKISNNKAEEAENILINLRGKIDDEDIQEKINQELLIIYLKSLENNSMPRDELLKKILMLERELKNKNNISITYILKEFQMENYYLNDCLVDHISNQQSRIYSLEHQNSQLKLENKNYFKQMNYNPSFVVETIEKSNTKFLLLSLGVLVLGIILSLEYLHCPALDWIRSLNKEFFIELFQ